MKPSLILVGSALLLGSCRALSDPVPDRPRPGTILLTEEQAKHHGLHEPGEASPPADPPLHPNSITTVAQPADVKVYAVGRRIDPRDPAVLHEAHVVYRQETTPRWRLQAPADQRILIGPQLTDGRQDTQPLLTKELTTFLHDQRRAAQANEAAIAALFNAVKQLTEQQRRLAEHANGIRAPEGEREDSGVSGEAKVEGDGVAAGETVKED